MNASLKAKLVTINVEQGTSGAFFATSPELKGLHVAKMSLPEVYQEVPRAIQLLYLACGVDVVVTPVEDGDEEYDNRWVAVPKAAADLSHVPA